MKLLIILLMVGHLNRGDVKISISTKGLKISKDMTTMIMVHKDVKERKIALENLFCFDLVGC